MTPKKTSVFDRETNDLKAAQNLREQALCALREGRFDLAEEVLARGELTIETVVENLRIYHAELLIQNEELRRSQSEREEALARFTAFFNSLPIAELIVDRQGLIMDANPEASRVFELKPTHLHQHFFVRLVDERDRGGVIQAWSRLEVNDTIVLKGLRFRGNRGEHARFIGDLHVARLNPERDNRRRLLCAVLDRTEEETQRYNLKTAYKRLRDGEERYRILAEFSPDWEYWTAPDGDFLYVSPACEQITGFPAEDFLEDAGLLERLIHVDDRPLWREHFHDERFQLSDQRSQLEFRLYDRDGDLHWIEHVCTPVFDDDGKHRGRRGVNREVSERKRAQQALREHELQYRALFESASEGMSVLVDGRFTKLNQAAVRMLGYEDDSRLIGAQPWEISPSAQSDGQSSFEKAKALMEQALRKGAAHAYWEHRRADDQLLSVELNLSRIELQGQPALLALWRDLTHEQAAREREARSQTVFEKTSEGIVFTDADARILMVNPAFTEITGYTEADVLGQNPRLLQSGRHDEAFYQALWASIQETGSWRGEFWNRRKSGEIYPQQSTISAVHNGAGQLTGYIGVFGDLSNLRRSEAALYRLAHHDVLTGLPNRTLLRAGLEQALARARRGGQSLALLFLDLDLFKNVNDTLGHPVGDRLLQQVAAEMEHALPESCLIARVGGDEFVVVSEDITEPSVAARLAVRILNCFDKPFAADGRELFITASIGIGLFPTDGETIDELLSHADLAMYQAKEHGRNTYRFFEAAMTVGADERLRLETALRGARAREQLFLVYQPQIQLDDEALIGVEALVRWRHPQLGVVSPGVFIPIAEEIGLIREIGHWVLEQGLRQLAAWDLDGVHVPRMAINLSVQQIESPELLEQVGSALEQTGVSPERLELEVTESMLMRHVEQAINNLYALREMGIGLAIDDFGSGYSSLRYLKKLPIHRLKIDRSFVEHLTQDANDDAIVRAVVALGRSMGLDVLAEGVETRSQADFLLQENCHQVQGFLFGRPMAPEDIAERVCA